MAPHTSEQDLDSSLLAELMQRAAAAQASNPAPPSTPAARSQPVPEVAIETPRRSVRTVRRGGTGEALAYLAAAALGAGLWMLDGYYTLIALRALGFPVVATVTWPWLLPPAGLASWAIPLGIEAIEQVFLGRRGWPLAVFAGVAGLNALATGYGLWSDLAGRTVFLAEGSTALWLLATIGGVVLAFGPGRLLLRALGALFDLVR